MLEFEQLKQRLVASEPDVRELREAIAYDARRREIEELETKASAPGFWDNMEESQKILKKTGKLKNTVGLYEDIKKKVIDVIDY